VTQSGDPWEAIAAYATPVHTERKERKSSADLRHRASEPKRPLTPSLSAGGGEDVRRVGEGTARKHKTPEQLESYSKKRSFDKTPEPLPGAKPTPPPDPLPSEGRGKSLWLSHDSPANSSLLGTGNAFVVHRHHASRLHYDLRLEQNGVLKSWAVPKGLPPRPGIMRLAVNVEDHPLEYVNFEGAIPKGEYGGGMMWKFAQGRYEITKQKKDGFYFRLQSPQLNAEYRTHHTKENQWLLERVDNPQTDWLRDPIEPMLARPSDKPPASEDYLYEVKWDGIRAMISLDEGEIRIHGRNRMDFTKQFPELLIPDQAFRATSGLFDGEIVCLEADGRPSFRNVIHRMQQKTEGAIERAKAKYPAVCYVFDCLYLDGRAIVNEPLTRRREWLQDAIKKDTPYRVSEVVEDGAAFFEAVKEMGLEGLMAKQRNSTYLSGKRSDSWLKIKTRQTIECAIIGYTKGKGDREKSFGALHLAQANGDELKYLGKVGSGFDDDSLKAVSAELQTLKTIKRPIKEKPLDDARSVWVQPKLMCEVEFASLTPDGLLREAVFVRLRPDLNLS
jgi:DNA ligase D-like protein (predicted ligase)/DNA ligase D-like protein (predicted 3'-phosphoesterase)